MSNELHAVNNVIELKPGKKYLLVFKGDIRLEALESVILALKAHEIDCFAIALQDGEELTVIEVPEVQE